MEGNLQSKKRPQSQISDERHRGEGSRRSTNGLPAYILYCEANDAIIMGCKAITYVVRLRASDDSERVIFPRGTTRAEFLPGQEQGLLKMSPFPPPPDV